MSRRVGEHERPSSSFLSPLFGNSRTSSLDLSRCCSSAATAWRTQELEFFRSRSSRLGSLRSPRFVALQLEQL